MRLFFEKIIPFLLLGICIFISCHKQSSCKYCDNIPPIAKAGDDFFIDLPKDSAILDGSRSSDVDGVLAKYEWSKLSGPSSFTINNSALSITLVENLTTGVYSFLLKVTDNGGLTDQDTVVVSVNSVSLNHSPVANANVDQTIVLPASSVILNGNLSTDPDNNITTYQWVKISGPLTYSLSSANAAQTQANSLVEGIYQFQLKVMDVGGLFSYDTVQVNVLPDTTNQTEVIYDDLVWNLWHDPNDPNGIFDEIYLAVGDNNNQIPDNPGPTFRVYVKRDSTSNWAQVGPQNMGCIPYYYFMNPQVLYIEVCPLDYNLVSKRGAVKIVY